MDTTTAQKFLISMILAPTETVEIIRARYDASLERERGEVRAKPTRSTEAARQKVIELLGVYNLSDERLVSLNETAGHDDDESLEEVIPDQSDPFAMAELRASLGDADYYALVLNVICGYNLREIAGMTQDEFMAAVRAVEPDARDVEHPTWYALRGCQKGKYVYPSLFERAKNAMAE